MEAGSLEETCDTVRPEAAGCLGENKRVIRDIFGRDDDGPVIKG